MDLTLKLSSRIGISDVHEILRLTQESDARKQELYRLMMGQDEGIGYQAAWVFTHFSAHENEWLYSKQGELIDEVLICRHGGKRRVILCLLFRQPMPQPIRVDLLDFCLQRMVSCAELPGVRSLCMKIAYELCRPFPELIHELKTMLSLMEGDLTPSITSSRSSIMKAAKKGRTLQKF